MMIRIIINKKKKKKGTRRTKKAGLIDELISGTKKPAMKAIEVVLGMLEGYHLGTRGQPAAILL